MLTIGKELDKKRRKERQSETRKKNRKRKEKEEGRKTKAKVRTRNQKHERKRWKKKEDRRNKKGKRETKEEALFCSSLFYPGIPFLKRYGTHSRNKSISLKSASILNKRA